MEINLGDRVEHISMPNVTGIVRKIFYSPEDKRTIIIIARRDWDGHEIRSSFFQEALKKSL